MAPGTTHAQTRAGRRAQRRRHHRAASRRRRRLPARLHLGRLHQRHLQGRPVEAELRDRARDHAAARPDRRRPGQLPQPGRRRPGRRRARHQPLPRQRRPGQAQRRRQQARRRDGDPARAGRAARPGRQCAAGNHHQAALRPCRRPWRDDLGAVADDPHRDHRRHRAEQRQILARRPPGADLGQPVGEQPARPVDAREPAGADRQRRLGAAEVGRRDRLRLGPGDGPAHQPGAPHRRSAPTSRRAWSAATPRRRSTSCRR